jgi:hypothetical protein
LPPPLNPSASDSKLSAVSNSSIKIPNFGDFYSYLWCDIYFWIEEL